jgi:AcrR family transcriptional regulator
MVPTATAGNRRRLTQAERSAATKTRLLDATIDCLVELGWSGTTTTEVVRRAGVSRGAQVHHYPAKDDLVLAAVEHLEQRRIDEYRAAFESLAAADRTPGAAFDLLWVACTGDTFAAWLELLVAARTSPSLRVRLEEVEQRFRDATLDLYQDMFAETAVDPTFARISLRFAFSVIDGMALSRLASVDEAELTAVREAFKTLTAPFFPSTQGGSR